MEEGLVLKTNLKKDGFKTIWSLLPLPEEEKGVQKTHRDRVPVEEIEKRLWVEPTELLLLFRL